ncbi:MAG: VIT domain-containing protein [Myxococcota bacterium]|jgi:Ca-activated chloride channel family protein|nr:VIT domain-containing protein [Myxococcota bacterium]
MKRHFEEPRRAIAYVVSSVLLFAFVVTTARADETVMPELVATIDGREVPLPSLKSDFDANLQGDLATVRVTQTFENPYDAPLHARYIFPLPTDAAVFAMRMSSGDQMIEAEIHEKKQARAVFENAKERGNQAALLDQHRPNVFTQEVANLMPGLPIRVELEYAHVVEKQDGAYRFHIPTVVGPRFVPRELDASQPGAPTLREGEPAPLVIGAWNLPASPPVAAPDEVDRERVSIRVALAAGMPIQWIQSPTHRVQVDRLGEAKRKIELAAGRTVDNKDFELHYQLAGHEVAAGLTTFVDGMDGFLSLLIEPPASARDAEITAREMVFVLDCSGSMAGIPMAASKRFMTRTLQNMRPSDSFRIIRFSDAATEWSERPLRATPANIRAGLRYVHGLSGMGGTHMASGIRAALSPRVEPGALRIVVFLTDGYIGNDVEIVRLLDTKRGEARLFSFGVGNSVNRYLIEEMARVGRGAARIVRPTEDAEVAADELVERLAAPVLTDIEIDWNDAAVADVYPQEIPDLFLGQTVRVLGRFEGSGRYRVTVRGRIAGDPVTMPLDVELPGRGVRGEGPDARALPIIWARSQIEDRMIEYIKPSLPSHERDAVQSEVTDLGLAHRLMTQWTSFVAVAKPVVNPGGEGRHADVAVAQVEGVPDTAYPQSALRHGGNGLMPPGQSPQLLVKAGGFNGHAAPEPSTWIALLVVTALAGISLRRPPTAR